MIAVIVAGGKGTRLGDICGEVPKPMVPVGGKPVLWHQIALLKRWGAREVYLLTGYRGQVIRDYFGDGRAIGVPIRYHQEDTPLGTAGCLKALRDMVREPFLLLYGDIMLDMKLDDFLLFHGMMESAATLAVHPNDHPFDSDLVVMEDDGRISGFVPKDRKPGYYANRVSAAVYVLSPTVFGYIPEEGASDFVRDVFPVMLAAGERLYGYKTAEYIKDMGTAKRYEQVSRDYENGKIHRLSRSFPRAAIFLDRDGTVVEEVDLLHRVEDLELLPFSAAAVKKINRSEFYCFVVTNQPVVARNLCSLEAVREVHRKLETLLGEEGAYLNDIYFCPHHPDKGYPGENPALKVDCNCRKPKPGMIQAAAGDYPVDLNSSWIIGDRTTDIQTGINAGLRTILVRTGMGGKDGRFPVEADFVFDHLEEAVQFILEKEEALQNTIRNMVAAVDSERQKGFVVISVGGQARSGKSTFVRLLSKALEEKKIDTRVLSLDNWLVGADERTEAMTVRERYRCQDIEQDLKRLLSGDRISLGRYDPYSREISNGGSFCLDGAACLIVDGVVALATNGLRDLSSLRVFVEIPEARRRQRFYAYYRWKDLPEEKIDRLYRQRLGDEVPLIAESQQYAHIIVRT